MRQISKIHLMTTYEAPARHDKPDSEKPAVPSNADSVRNAVCVFMSP